MKLTINMIGIITQNLPAMKTFYTDVLGMKILLEMEEYVEFKQNGVRFALSTADVMQQATGLKSYAEKKAGHSFELAFQADSPEQVDKLYAELIQRGATAVKSPEDMPWGQRTAFFADPDGNVHEVFADVEQK